MRYLPLFSLMLLPLQAMAGCPHNKFIQENINEVKDRLLSNSHEPLVIESISYTVEHGDDGKAVDDLIAGNFEGYYIDRFKEVIPGKCVYRLRDDRTPARGTFVLTRINDSRE